MKKRIRIGLAAAGAAALVLTACGGGGGDDGSGTDSPGVTNLTWSMWIGSTEDQKAWEGVAAGVTADHPDIKLTLQGAPFTDYWTKISTQLGSSAAPCVVSMQSRRINQFTESLVPLDELITKNKVDTAAFDAGALKNLNVGGQQYALPYDTGPVIMYYNKDMFAKAGVEPKNGWTAADFEAAGEKLKAADAKLYANATADIFVESMVHSYNGGRAVTDDNKIVANDPQFVAGVDWLGSLASRGYSTTADGADTSAADNAFIAGQAATNANGPWVLLDFNSKVKFGLGVVELPAGTGGGKTFSAGSGFGISKMCKEPDKAFAAITSMTSEKTLTGLAEQGRAFPGRTASQAAWYQTAKDVAGVEETLKAAQTASIPMPGSADSEKFAQLLGQYIPAALNGTEPAGDALNQIQKQIGS